MCKKPVYMTIACHGFRGRVRGFLHERGCMGSRYPHLDILVGDECVLGGVARIRGFRAKCDSLDGVLELYLDWDTVTIRVEGYRLHCRGLVYIMRSRSGGIYVGPVEWSKTGAS